MNGDVADPKVIRRRGPANKDEKCISPPMEAEEVH